MSISTSSTSAGAAQPRGDDFGAVVRSEWLKLRTLWSIRLVALLVVASAAAGAALQTISYSAARDLGLDVSATEATAAVVDVGRQAAQLMVAVLAILVVGSELGSGSIRSSLLAVPRRGRLLAAKALVTVLATALLSVLSAVVAYLVTLPLLTRFGLAASPGSPAVLRSALTFVLYEVLVALFALAVATLVRHTVVAVVLVLGVLLVLPVPAAFLGGPLDLPLSQLTLTAAGSTVAHLGLGGTELTGGAMLAVAVWLVVPAALGVAGFVRRDV